MTDNKNIQTVVVPAEAPSIDKALIVRSVVYLIALANYLAPFVGLHLNLHGSEQTIYQIVSAGLMVGSFCHAYWKNQNISKFARIASQVVKQINIFAGRNPVPVPSQPVAPTPKPVQEAPKPVTPAQPVAPVQPVDTKPSEPTASQPSQDVTPKPDNTSSK
jgi:cytochrome c oxidase subunit IV